jgi:metal iron transporter
MIGAATVGQKGIDALLVVSQVVLAIVLPFIAFPLIWLTSSKEIMTVRQPRATSNGGLTDHGNETTDAPTFVDFSSGKIMTGIGCVIWLIMAVANAYVIVTLAMGNGA